MRAKLFGSVAALALLGIAASPAQAFERMSWHWDMDVYQDVKNDAWIWASFYPSGMTTVQSVQTYIGDVVAKAKLDGNYLPDEESDPCGFSGCGMSYWWPTPPAPLTIDDLGHAVQDVSALGIVSQIESNVPVYADHTQSLMGEYFTPAEIRATAEAGEWFAPVEIAIDQSVSAVAVLDSIALTADKPFVIAANNSDQPCGFYGCFGEYDSNIDQRDTLVLRHGFDYGDVATYYPIDTNAILQADINQFAAANTTASAVAFQDLSQITDLGTYKGLDVKGLVANQSVSAAGLVSSISNVIDKAVKGTAD